MRSVWDKKASPLRMVAYVLIVSICFLSEPPFVNAQAEGTSNNNPFPSKLISSYDLYWKGLRVVTADSTLRATPTTFEHKMTWRTRGVLRWFMKGKTNASSSGKFDHGFSPLSTTYSSDGKWGKRAFERTVDFDSFGKGTIASVTDPWGEENEREPMPEGLDFGPDPVTLALHLAKAPLSLNSEDNSLTLTSYDGIRAMAYDITCNDVLKPLRDTGHSPYRGLSKECIIKARQTGGFSKAPREKEERDPRENHGMSLLFQKVEGQDIYVPVQGIFTTDDGTLKLYLTAINMPLRPLEVTGEVTGP